MSDIMRPLPFAVLLDWMTAEYRTQNAVFGIREDAFFHPASASLSPFGDKLSVPVGPAAGPHTQLAANIVASYVSGARFMELKTVQVMDGEQIREAVAKPCINAEDEAYNCEWSTELTVEEAFEEYVKAWFLIAVIQKEAGLGDAFDAVYNMSVGYNLEGIKTEKIDRFIEGLKDAGETEIFKACRAELKKRLPEFTRFGEADLEAIPAQLCNAITLSTLHGTQPAEIKSIASYLLTEKKLHTFVKLNPTLLGYEFARRTLDELGYDYIAFDDHHFKADLQYDDALVMLTELREIAAGEGLVFGVKLTNTFPVEVENKELPATEMYMSGRSLLPLTVSLAAKLSEAFGGTLPISFSGGADAGNVRALLSTGITPITVATTLLKPGGYGRFRQIAAAASEAQRDYSGIDVARLNEVRDELLAAPEFAKRWREKVRSRKTTSSLPPFDCFKAPCKDGGCPIEQQIPEYLKLTADGRYDEAFEVIAIDNTAPTVLGVLCAEPCREHCTRLDYESSLGMRDMKKIASDEAEAKFIEKLTVPPLKSKRNVAVIGAGPAGLAVASFLRRAGVAVTVMERFAKGYGIVRYVIPSFRIDEADIDRDEALARAYGVDIRYGVDENYDLDRLLAEYDDVVIATGAWKQGVNPVKDGAELVDDALDVLWRAKVEGDPKLGAKVAVVGAGDVAMDSARLALRTPGVESVAIVYRRTETYMPAAQEDVNIVREEGITIYELHNPVKFDGSTLTCELMKLGTYDDSGRKSTEGTGEFVELPFDTVIAATGARVDTSLYEKNGLDVERGRVRLSETFEASRPGVYVIGDGRKGPSTIVAALADAKVVAAAILAKDGLEPGFALVEVEEAVEAIYARRGLLDRRRKDASEGERCLKCDAICEICVEVCPNRANIRVPVPGFANRDQIVHIDALCNECGNCATFCPHAGRPYTDKPTVFARAEDFAGSTNDGFFKAASGYDVRIDGVVSNALMPAQLPDRWARLLTVLAEDGRPLFTEV